MDKSIIYINDRLTLKINQENFDVDFKHKYENA